VTSSGGSKALAIAVYTVLRVALFAAVWLTLELLTPISGLWAIVFAILISGAISIIVLDRQRDRVAAVAAGFFRGINERIEASARAEDVDDEPAAAEAGSGEGEQPAQHDAVDKQ
jgi:uncharacterized membrane protein YccC